MEESVDLTQDRDEPAEAMPEAAPAVEPDIGYEVAQFVTSVDALLTSLGPVMFSLQADERESAQRFRDYAEKYGEITHEDDSGFSCRFEPPYDIRSGRLSKRIRRAETAAELVPRVFVLALVSQFDAFLGRLLRAAFLMRPELIASSERTLTLAQILEAGSVEAATDIILDKEIETALRKSRKEQFEWMEKKFDVPLRKGLESWATLIEVTERRNLFAHTNGVVSGQYLLVCRDNGVVIKDDCVKGAELEVTPDYFREAWACHYEIGVKLAQVLWRKLRPDQVDGADTNLVNVTYELIVDNRLDLAKELLDFACTPAMKPGSAETRYVHILNRAQAYKWSDDADECRRIVEAEDWSACEPKYRLAVAVLLDDFADAAKWMKTIGSEGTLTQSDYQEWPLFKEFRKTAEFTDTYKDVFGEPFVHIEKLLADDEDQRRRQSFEDLRKFLDREAQEEDSDASSDDDASV